MKIYIHEVASIIVFEFHDNYSDIQQNSTCNAGNAQKRKMHVELERLHLLQFLSRKSFAKYFTEKKRETKKQTNKQKNKNKQTNKQTNKKQTIFPSPYGVWPQERTRAGMLRQGAGIHIANVARLQRPTVVECRCPKCLATWKWHGQFGLS